MRSITVTLPRMLDAIEDALEPRRARMRDLAERVEQGLSVVIPTMTEGQPVAPLEDTTNG